jgi:hypothetical protein
VLEALRDDRLDLDTAETLPRLNHKLDELLEVST